jgi:hypothetical protein
MSGAVDARSLGFSLSFPCPWETYDRLMKVSSAPAQPSALDTWLHESENLDAVSIEAARRGPETAAAPHGSASGRDSAEGLLGLDIWGADSSAERSLVASAPAPDALTAGSAQSWAMHIFTPLV